MKVGVGKEGGAVLVITLCFTFIAGIGAAAFLQMINTQVKQVRVQSRYTRAFYTAEVGLEKGVELLEDDFNSTPEGMLPSWSDDKVYTATGYIQLSDQKSLSITDPDYENDFYGLVAETDYELDKDGAYKTTYRVDIANVPGWRDRIWVKSTGRYYHKNASTGGYIFRAERRVLSLLRARQFNLWNNAIFAGEGQSGRLINGNVDIRGSVHLLGTSLGDDDLAMDMSGGGNVKNHYKGMPAALASRVPPIAKAYGLAMLDSLETEVRVRGGKVALSGTAFLGEPHTENNALKETLEGVYVTHGYGGNQGDRNVYSDNGKHYPYDLGEYSVEFPRLSEPHAGYDNYIDYLRANGCVIIDPEALDDLANIKKDSVFTYGNGKGSISVDGKGHMTISGIVVVEGDIKFDKKIGTIEYTGKGSLTSTGSVGINCNIITRWTNTYPKVDILGVMAADEIRFETSQNNVMGLFYAEHKITSTKQTSVAGSFVSNYFDMGQQVPAIYQVPDTAWNLPPGMIGSFNLWAIQRLTWSEV